MQQPPYPSTTRAGGFRFELDCERIVQSDTWALADARLRPLLLMTWFTAWQQTPCGSLPGDDAIIAARLGLSPDEFLSVKPILLRGWSQADDGRLYHPVLTELVIDMIGRKTRETQRKAAYRQRQREARDAILSHGTHTGQPGDGHGNDSGAMRESSGSDDTTTTTTTTIKDKPIPDGIGSRQAEPDAPVCPQREILALYAKRLPDLPQPRVWEATFIFTIQEADHAARMWFAQRVPAMTLADWRDHLLSLHLAGLHVEDWQERDSSTREWNHAFAAGIAAEIVLGGARHG